MDLAIVALLLFAGLLAVGLVVVNRSLNQDHRHVAAVARTPQDIATRAESYRFDALTEKLTALQQTSIGSTIPIETELRRFVAVVAANPHDLFTIPAGLSVAWQMLVREHTIYHGLTQSILGDGGRIDSQTMHGMSEADRDQTDARYRAAYEELFNGAPPSRLFRRASQAFTLEDQHMLQARVGRYQKTFRRPGEKIDTSYMPGNR